MNSKILKLAKLIIQFAEVESDKGVLSYTGDLAVGIEIFIEKDGEFIPAENGEYVIDGKTITVKDGKVEKISEIAAEENIIDDVLAEENVPAEENIPTDNDIQAQLDEKDAKIAELKAKLDEKDAEIAELKAKLDESAGKKAEEEFKAQDKIESKNKALKYFK